MPAISMSKTSRIGLLAAATALLASCGGGGGSNPIQAADQFHQFREAADTLIVTGMYGVLGDGRSVYRTTRCSYNQCSNSWWASSELTVQDWLKTEEERPSLSNARLVRRINGVEIREYLTEDAEGSTVWYDGTLDNIWFDAAFENSTDGVRRGYGSVVGQASGHPPETTARYNGAWTWMQGINGPNYGAAALDYRFTSTGGEIDAYFYTTATPIEQYLISGSAIFRGVDVNALGKFRQLRRDQQNSYTYIDGSFFGGAADEVGGIVEWSTEGGERVLGAFGAEAQL